MKIRLQSPSQAKRLYNPKRHAALKVWAARYDRLLVQQRRRIRNVNDPRVRQQLTEHINNLQSKLVNTLQSIEELNAIIRGAELHEMRLLRDVPEHDR